MTSVWFCLCGLVNSDGDKHCPYCQKPQPKRRKSPQ